METRVEYLTHGMLSRDSRVKVGTGSCCC